ncbi:MAG: GNAT family N-acetyltransferase [Candidatus Bathyarchaeota archaeon]|nr:MAG: GNAT family N-acetyltransferase [Candidatus Bathyarchaeota archaeon]
MMKVERAIRQDIRSIAECCVALRLHQRERSDGYRPSLRAIIRQVEGNFERPHCHHFVAKEAGKVVGVVLVRLRRGGRSAYLARAYVIPSHRRQGVMRRLESTVVDFLRQRGFSTLDLTVVPYNEEGMSTWPTLGYRPNKIVMTKQI